MNKSLSELESMYPSYHFTIFGSDEECFVYAAKYIYENMSYN